MCHLQMLHHTLRHLDNAAHWWCMQIDADIYHFPQISDVILCAYYVRNTRICVCVCCTTYDLYLENIGFLEIVVHN